MNKVLVRPTWTHGTTEVFKTGTWRAAMPHYVKPPSPCHQACPVNGDIAEWIGLARARDFRGAWEVLTRHNPFPAIAGRICHHPCETSCNRGAYDESVSICKLERAVGDIALESGWAFEPPATERNGHIAIVGGGPSGLSAAFQLRQRGWRVTIYESQRKLGGLMRYGIPSYRLARPVLDGEIARIVALGVEVQFEHALKTAADFDRVRATHDAVYLAVGASRPKRLPNLPDRARWLMDGAEYLARSAAGTPPALGRRLVVVGGGSAAMDVARSARRAAHDVTILSLERVDQMPAQREELAEALEEGIALMNGAMLTAVTPKSGAGLSLSCKRVQFEPGATRGQFTARPIAGSEFEIAADAVVVAIGQDVDLTALSQRLPAEGGLLTVGERQATSVDGVWAGGDAASMARFVTEAIGMGKRAALDIDRVLRGAPAETAGWERPVGMGSIATWYHPGHLRAAALVRPVSDRVATGLEVQLGLELTQALDEAGRCFSCGECTHCDNCFHYCPDLAIRRVNGGYEVLADYCKGCGICVKECPTGSMTMQEESK